MYSAPPEQKEVEIYFAYFFFAVSLLNTWGCRNYSGVVLSPRNTLSFLCWLSLGNYIGIKLPPGVTHKMQSPVALGGSLFSLLCLSWGLSGSCPEPGLGAAGSWLALTGMGPGWDGRGAHTRCHRGWKWPNLQPGREGRCGVSLTGLGSLNTCNYV